MRQFTCFLKKNAPKKCSTSFHCLKKGAKIEYLFIYLRKGIKMTLKIPLKYRPPLYFIILYLLLVSTSGFCTTVRYIITPNLQENALDIELIFPGNDPSHYYILPSWTKKPFPEITDIKARVEESRSKKKKSSDKEAKDVIVTYRLKTPNHQLQQDQRDEEFEIDHTHFRFTGSHLIIPSKINWKKNIAIKIEWKGIPAEWVIANSFDIHQTSQTLITSLSSLQTALFVGGEFDVFRWSREESTPYVVVKKSDKLSGESLLPLLQGIVESQRTFWNDYHFPHSIMAIFPTTAQHPFHAQAHRNAFIAFLPPFVDNEYQWASISQVLAHEYFHTWVPYKMMPEVPPDFDSLSWFSEGFVDYYSILLNYRAHILSPTQCINEINRVLYAYYTSPFRNVNNARLAQERYSGSMAMRLLPYQRGCLLALLWDAKIQQKTNGANTLDNVMLLLLQMTQDTGKPYSQAMIEELVGIYIGAQTAANDLQAHIIEGKTLVPPELLFGKKTSIRWMEDVGFQLIETKATGYIQGIEKERGAYKAGLRNGQVFRKIHRSENGMYHVAIIERGVERLISFPADGKDPIPQYVVPTD